MSTFFADVAKTLGADLGQNLLDKTGDFIGQITPLFVACFSFYVLLVIWDYYNSSLDVLAVDFIKKCCGWMLIIGLSLAPATYMKLAHIIYTMPDEIAGIFAGGYKVDASAMDASWKLLMDLLDTISKLHEKYQWYDIGVHFGIVIKIGLVITICGALVVGLSFAFYMVAKVSLALVLMIGPLFLGCLLFPATRQYAINWIGQCLNHILTCTMFVLLVKIQMAAFDKAINMALSGSAFDYVSAELLPPLFLLQTIIFLVVVFNIPSIASALTGGAAVSGASRHMMSLASGLGTAGRLVGRAGAATLNAASNRRSGGGVSPVSNKRPS
ncbi:TrbL/VirB6 plasmid conjugal transfer protein [Neisseria sicca ATCC 29256]|uniref:TrbL/VirB6 plasmid conjugal transfer protein n=1 Tax=Neisseria sicca ATCC 29256 TaxID=547045 RepID=C6M7B5_NEISI|nr:type IV secretion system protein [Neisseria sicca]EET43838.1 TrbL/VirB6 plasmid conjugal transfer protein [Neisseria sicca ATCC 29256]QMT39164.1 type IV secretion system protein [Neisseria sicca]